MRGEKVRDSIEADGCGVSLCDSGHAEELREQAQRCRRLARSVPDHQTVQTLTAMASEYEEKARTLKPIN